MKNLNVIEVAKQYVLAFKNVNSGLIREHFMPNAFKTGYFYDFETRNWTGLKYHSFEQMEAWTAEYNLNGIMPDTEIHATLLDVQDKMAIVKLKAEWAPGIWGHDYVILLLEDGKWLISTVHWQSLINGNAGS
ncbi:nuclear transport factor 2 family protein [uncultured Pedobacter sp.]|uniref:nuclear transport factor 2 family protein n=1 Tax=uncultured Pedobacter sp. TaxID=246139 RepID=UPI00260412D7|nr:nuclear transport factor 2 family protein [uncultured Pedobacter sp.]